MIDSIFMCYYDVIYSYWSQRCKTWLWLSFCS